MFICFKFIFRITTYPSRILLLEFFSSSTNLFLVSPLLYSTAGGDNMEGGAKQNKNYISTSESTDDLDDYEIPVEAVVEESTSKRPETSVQTPTPPTPCQSNNNMFVVINNNKKQISPTRSGAPSTSKENAKNNSRFSDFQSGNDSENRKLGVSIRSGAIKKIIREDIPASFISLSLPGAFENSCDVVLVVGNERYDAHKSVISVASSILKGMPTNGLQGIHEILLNLIKKHAWELVLQFMRTGRVDILWS